MPRTARRVRTTGPVPVAPEARAAVAALLDHAPKVPDLDAVILFGSSVDGTFDKRSDIDLLFLLDAPDPERTHADAVLDALRRTRSDSGVKRELNPVLAPLRRARLDQDFLSKVTQSGVVVWARPQRWLPPAKDAGRFVLLHWDPATLTPAQRSRIHRRLFGEHGRKTVRGRVYEWDTPGLIPKEHHLGPGALLVPQHDAAEVERVLQEAGATVRRQRFLIA